MKTYEKELEAVAGASRRMDDAARKALLSLERPLQRMGEAAVQLNNALEQAIAKDPVLQAMLRSPYVQTPGKRLRTKQIRRKSARRR